MGDAEFAASLPSLRTHLIPPPPWTPFSPFEDLISPFHEIRAIILSLHGFAAHLRPLRPVFRVISPLSIPSDIVSVFDGPNRATTS